MIISEQMTYVVSDIDDKNMESCKKAVEEALENISRLASVKKEDIRQILSRPGTKKFVTEVELLKIDV